MAACMHAGADAVCSHRAAAGLWRLDGFKRGVIEVTTTADRRVGGVITHRCERPLPKHARTRLGCIPLTTATRTLFDLASASSPAQLGRALDSALRQRLTSLERLERCLQENTGRRQPGTRTLRHLLAERDPRAGLLESPLEDRLLKLMRRHNLPLPVCQYRIVSNGRTVARVDFAYPELKLAIEADGYIYHSEKADWDHDRDRDGELSELGWGVLRVTLDQMRDRPGRVAERIRRARAERANLLFPD